MEKSNRVKILEICKITPYNSNSSDISLPLTPFDWLFMNVLPTKRLFYYKLTDSDPPFLDSIIPKLKKSLSLTLQHFLPASGNLVWPENSPKPFILYTPNDSVSFIVAEIHDSDFNHLSGNHPHEIKHSQILIPSIESSDLKTPLMAIQVTKFPNHDGFSIGISCHHVIFDGKSVSLFMKAWSHICKLNHSSFDFSLPDSLTPSFERSGNNSSVLNENPPSEFFPKERNLNIISYFVSPSNDFLHATFELTKSDIEKLKERVLLLNSMAEEEEEEENPLHLSTFVVAYAYAIFCLMKAKRLENEEKIGIGLSADVRQLINPALPSNYVGNCIGFFVGFVKGSRGGGGEEEEDGFYNIAKRISDIILVLKRSEIKASNNIKVVISNVGIKSFSVTSSPKFKYYETDFGWGKPKKIEIVSLGNNNISLEDARDGSNGVEIGVVLPSHEMDIFASLFSKGTI